MTRADQLRAVLYETALTLHLANRDMQCKNHTFLDCPQEGCRRVLKVLGVTKDNAAALYAQVVALQGKG